MTSPLLSFVRSRHRRRLSQPLVVTDLQQEIDSILDTSELIKSNIASALEQSSVFNKSSAASSPPTQRPYLLPNTGAATGKISSEDRRMPMSLFEYLVVVWSSEYLTMLEQIFICEVVGWNLVDCQQK